MKILMINGSPRKNGNTIAALRQLEQELSPTHQTELLASYSYTVNPCLSCYQCAKNGGKCIQKDDTNILLDKISEADMLILGTPVYWWGMSAQLKLIVDKFIARVDAFQNMPKKIVTVSVGASAVTDPQYRLIQEQTACIAEYLKWDYKASASFSAWQIGDLEKQADFKEKIKELAEKIK